MPVNYSRISNAQVAEPSHTAHGSYALPRSRRTPADASFSAYLEKSYLETKMRFDMPEDEVHRLASNAATRTRIMPEVLRRRQQCDKCAVSSTILAIARPVRLTTTTVLTIQLS
jgi:hypothetical protein